MSSLSYNQERANGWRIFCAGGYMEDCSTEAERNGFCAAWRRAEGISLVNWNSDPVAGAWQARGNAPQMGDVILCPVEGCKAKFDNHPSLITHLLTDHVFGKHTEVVERDEYSLLLFGDEDAAAVVAEAEAILAEKDAKPGLGIEMDVNWNSGAQL